MYKFLLISMVLIGFKAYAGLEALTIPNSLDSFTLSCFENDTWFACNEDTSAAPAGAYYFSIYTPSTQETIAIGFVEGADNKNTIVAACRSHPNAAWVDCSPRPGEVAEAAYSQFIRPADDGKGNLMLISEHSPIIAACRNAAGVWFDCSPENTQGFYPNDVSYANNQWIILDDMLQRDDANGITYNPAWCMNAAGTWAKCDLQVQDPTGDFYETIWAFNLVQFIHSTQEWVAVGKGQGDVFKSICRDNNYPYWHDCTGEIFSSDNGSARLVQNAAGELLEFSSYRSGLTFYSNTRCKSPNGPWTDCTGNLAQKNHLYTGITEDDTGAWVLVGYQLSNDGSEIVAHLTAQYNGTDWDVLSQTDIDKETGLVDAMWID